MKYQRRWLQIAEYVSVFSAVAGSIASLLLQQAAYATIPVSISLLLNLLNRQNFEKQTKISATEAIALIGEDTTAIANQLEGLRNQMNYLTLETPALGAAEDLNFLVSTMMQLRQHQTEIEQSFQPLKMQLDLLTEQFKKRPELGQIDSLMSIIIDLQQFINQLPQWGSLQQKQLVEIQAKIDLAIAAIPAQVEASVQKQIQEINQQK